MIEQVSITQRIFESQLEKLLSGAFAPGTRIDANVIAAIEHVSPTPVRCALHRLAGAGFLVSHAKEGFFTPRCMEQDLREAYDCCAALLEIAISRAEKQRAPKVRKNISQADGKEALALQTEKCFREIMALCANSRLLEMFDRVNLQLRPARLMEDRWIANGDGELRRIERAFQLLVFADLKKRVGAYHRRRQRFVAKIVAQMNGPQGGDLRGPC